MIGLIGGSGLSQLDGMGNYQWVSVDTPFGKPSDQVMLGEIDGIEFAFMPRHGRGHVIPPSDINYRANIYALKKLGVSDILAISAVGSLQEHLKPGMFVIVDQFIDRTFARKKTFFDVGCVAHVSLADPVCQRLGDHIQQASQKAAIEVQRGGTYLVMEGPQFSTKAESKLYRSWACDVIGMTNMPEAKLAREAQICYSSLAMVTDFDCWHPEHEHVTVQQVIETAHQNALKAAKVIRQAIPLMAQDQTLNACACKKALNFAVMTADAHKNPIMMDELSILFAPLLEDKA
jgi:5'-methylthioadenosine phosphorylase